jgi:hypothetical protein
MGLTYRGVDLQTDGIHLDLRSGLHEPATVRGEDDVIPGAAGRDLGARRKDTRRIILEGHVRGQGGTRDERALDFRTSSDALAVIFDRSLDPGTLEVDETAPALFPEAAPYLGLTGARTITARVVNVITGPVLAHMSYQTYSVELESVDSPPEWVEGS